MTDLLDTFRAAIPDGLEDIAFAAMLGALGVFAGLVLHAIAFGILRRIISKSESKSDDIVITTLARPTKYSLVALGLVLAARETPLLADVWEKLAGFVMPALVGWIALAIVRALAKAAELHLDLENSDNLQARRKQTRLRIFSRIATFVIVFITIGLMMLSIPGVRDLGVAVMASAGLAALAVGAAAQPALKALIGGLQMALTEPIRIDDVVIIEGEWGRIEDIRTTYVVVRIWDERRLIVPANKFLEESFQNWTRKSAEMLGTVMLHLDPMAQIQPIREEFERQITANPLWDGRVQAAQVTETGPGSIELRLLMSARDASESFDLRCQIREGMLDWMRRTHPEVVARRRIVPVGDLEIVDDG